MNHIIPPKLQSGDTIMVVSPARSLSILSEGTKEIANRRLAELGLKLLFADHIAETDLFNSSSIESRVHDLHQAFGNPEVKAIFTTIGGFNSNQLLAHLDWELIRANPKILCGYSDITALQNAILAKTGLVTYYGPHYSSFGEKLHFDYSLDYVKKCLFNDAPYEITPSAQWSDDPWYIDQDARNPLPNLGYATVQEGEAEGTIIGGNLCTLNLLQGTEYFPNLEGSILFLEDDSLVYGPIFDRDLQSLIHQPGFSGVKGLVIGRFQKESKIGLPELEFIISSKPELKNMPAIVNADFGHTNPKATWPIGGTAHIAAQKEGATVIINKH